jgi:ferritin-like metal-binding protein YciE
MIQEHIWRSSCFVTPRYDGRFTKEQMMATDSLRTHMVEELTDLLDAEHQLTSALPKMAKAASTPALRNAFTRHLQETRTHVTRVSDALRQLGEKPSRKTCEAMKGLLTEGEEMMNQAPEGVLRDAVMITAAQKVEHYEMASYGTVRTYAQVLGHSQVARLLGRTLKEEKAADSKLTAIAERSVNEKASMEWSSQEEQGFVQRGTEWVSGAMNAASRQLAGTARRAAASIGIANERTSRSRSRRQSSSTRRSRARTKRSSR